MRPTAVTKVLCGLVILFVAMAIFATNRALYYHDLYAKDPRVEVHEHDKTIYARFDPNRSSAYTCTIQKVTKDRVGMVCESPDQNVTINCTVGEDVAVPSQYFC